MFFKRLYLSPDCETCTALQVDMLCDSQDPVDGGLEGITEEDWVV